jgi:outer membrane murein-binding lipoprotein Lpp
MIRWRAAMVVIGIALLSLGCSGKVLSPSPADQLRRQNAELSAKVESLERQLSEARTALAAAEQRASAGAGTSESASTLSPEAIEATPHLAGITIAGSSHTDRPISSDGCVARVYVSPVDGRGRFMQVVGTASVTLYWSPPGCAAEVLSCQEFGPVALRDAYRSGFGGTHYTLEWPVATDPSGEGKADGAPGSAWTCGSPVEVKVEFTDARSGRVFTARRALVAMATARGDRQ